MFYGIYSSKSRAEKEVKAYLRLLLGVRRLDHIVLLLSDDLCVCRSTKLLELTAKFKGNFSIVKYGICTKCGVK